MNTIFRFLAVFLIVGLFIHSCSKKEYVPKEVEKIVIKEIVNEVPKKVIREVPVPKQPEIFFKEISLNEVNESGNEMFTQKDEEVVDGVRTIYNTEKRSFNVNEMVFIKALGNNKYRICNFLPRKLSGIQILAKVKDVEMAPLKIMLFNEFPALYEYEGELPFTSQEVCFEDIQGGKVSGSYFNQISPSDLELTIDCADEVFRKMKSIKAEIHYRFGDYSRQAAGGWAHVTWKDARAFIPLVLNLNYMFSTDEFKKRVLEYPYDFYDDSNKTPLNKENVYRGYIQNRRQALGTIVKGGLGGLGGGETFGLNRDYCLGHDNNFYDSKKWYVALDTYIHEFGHVVGYGHDGNMTYPQEHDVNGKKVRTGMVPLGMELYHQMLNNKQLPFNEFPYDKDTYSVKTN